MCSRRKKFNHVDTCSWNTKEPRRETVLLWNNESAKKNVINISVKSQFGRIEVTRIVNVIYYVKCLKALTLKSHSEKLTRTAENKILSIIHIIIDRFQATAFANVKCRKEELNYTIAGCQN